MNARAAGGRLTGELVGALELGGSHVSAALVEATRGRLATPIRRRRLDPGATREALLERIVAAAGAIHDPAVRRWGVATPGPFDYRAGISLIRGVSKLDALYGVDMRSVLADAVGAPPALVTFVNDADAFLLGEATFGAARGARRALGITLGTGFGSAFIVGGELVDEGPGVPPEGRFDLVPFDGRPVEDMISGRGLQRAYAEMMGLAPARPAALPGAAEIARRARAGESAARACFADFGRQLGRFLAPWLDAFAPQAVVVGGSIARAWDLFAEAMLASARAQPAVRIKLARRPAAAALLGAARHALSEGRSGTA